MSYTGLRNINVETIAFDPQNPSTIYTGAGEGRGGIHKSTDGGQTWEIKIDPPEYDGFTRVRDIVVDPLNSSNVYVGIASFGGILCSDDGAETWNKPNQLGEVHELGIHPTNPSTLYAAHLGGVYRSTDRARNWVLIGNGLPNTLNYTSLAVDPSDGETVYTPQRGPRRPRLPQCFPLREPLATVAVCGWRSGGNRRPFRWSGAFQLLGTERWRDSGSHQRLDFRESRTG